MKLKEIISEDKFKKTFPYCKEYKEWVNLLDNVLESKGINTKERICMFIAQCGHETLGWSKFYEILNYSDKALRVVWGKYFDNDNIAKEYDRKPEKIANRIYANRMGNSDEKSGDGWKYRGRGAIQLTGKNNYIAFSKDTGIDVVTNPDIILNDKNLILETAIWYWNKNNLNIFADNKDILGCTKKINGGKNGLSERQHLFEVLMS